MNIEQEKQQQEFRLRYLEFAQTEHDVMQCPHCHNANNIKFNMHFSRITNDNTIHSTLIYDCLSCKKQFHKTYIYIISNSFGNYN